MLGGGDEKTVSLAEYLFILCGLAVAAALILKVIFDRRNML